MAYREVAVWIASTVIVGVMILSIPAHVWEKATPEQRQLYCKKSVEQFAETHMFCRNAKLWVVYDQETNSYQIWIRCIDKERRL